MAPAAHAWRKKYNATWPETAQRFGVHPDTLRARVSEWARENGEGDTVDDFVDSAMSLEEKIEALMRLAQDVQQSVDPVLTHKTIRLDVDRPVAILLAGCMQLGGRYTFHSVIKTQFNRCISLDRTYVGLFGDEIDNFYAGTFAGAGSEYDQLIVPKLQRTQWENYLNRIQDRTLWGLASQHGTIWDEKKGFVPIKDMYLERNIPFFDGQAYISLYVGDERYKLAVAHEFPGNSMYNPNHPQKRALWQRFPLADVIAMADKHQYSVQEFMYGDNEFLAGDKASPFVYLVQIGTAKGGPDKYTIRSWERGQTEWPWMVVWPNEHKVKITRHFDDVEMWLESGG
jgi:transposase-like protein